MSFKPYLKNVGEFPDYMVSPDGRVFNKHGRELRQVPDRYGYLLVTLSDKGIKKTCTVHRLVANAFIPNPENKRTVNHIDGNKRNNDISNLEWSTDSENMRHAYSHDLRRSILTPAIQKMGGLKSKEKYQKPVLVVETGKIYPCLSDCAADTGCQPSGISRCCNGEAKSHHGYHFKWA